MPFSDNFSISIHSLRMEGDCNGCSRCNNIYISIHSLRMEGDIVLRCIFFQCCVISIHSLRMEGDRVSVRDNEK